MQVFLKRLSGEVLSLVVSSSASIDDVRALSGLEVYGTVSENSILEEFEIDDGGKRKKRKKKNFTTPKRKPHVRKKVPLRILKMFDISKDTIKPLRDLCPKCGGATYLAKHPDGRVYCGKCHHTSTSGSGGKK